VRAFSQQGHVIAWSTGFARSAFDYCGRVRVRDLSTGRQWLLGWETEPPGESDACTTAGLFIANAGTKVVWGGLVDCCNHHYGAIYVASPALKKKALDGIEDDYSAVGRFLTGMASDGTEIVYSLVTVVANDFDACFSDEEQTSAVTCQFRTKAGVVKRVVGANAIPIPHVPPTYALDVFNRRLAVVPADLRFGHDGMPRRSIEVRDVRTGSLVLRTRTLREPRAVAISEDVLAVLTGSQKARWVESFDARTGRSLGRVAVPRMTVDQIDAAGSVAVTLSGREIRVVRPFIRRSGVLAVSRMPYPSDFSIEGGRVAWVESPGSNAKRSRIAMLQLR
jgi:hypothetical protein